MFSTSFYCRLFFPTSKLSEEEFLALLLEGRQTFLSSEVFISLSHSELLYFLRNDITDISDEHELFQAIIRWGISKCRDSDDEGIAAGRGRRPSIGALKSVIAPPGKEDLMKEIRVGLFSKTQWDDVSDSQEAGLLPLTLEENKVLKKYLAAPGIDKERMIYEGDLASFNLIPRAMSNGNDTDAIPDTENQERSGSKSPPVSETNNSATRRSSSGTISRDDNESNSEKDQKDGHGQKDVDQKDGQNCHQDSSMENDESESTESR